MDTLKTIYDLGNEIGNRGVFYKQAERCINSIKNSTDVFISLKNESVFFEGKHSPYITHKQTSVTDGHGYKNFILFRNYNISFAICSFRVAKELEGRNVLVASIPSYFFNDDLFLFPASRPDWLDGNNVYMIIPNHFMGYDEEGNPEYSEEAISEVKEIEGRRDTGEILTPLKRG